MRTIVAHYTNGLLEPVTPLPLKNGERVDLIVVRRPETRRWDLERLASTPEEDLTLAERGLAEWADALDAEDRS